MAAHTFVVTYTHYVVGKCGLCSRVEIIFGDKERTIRIIPSLKRLCVVTVVLSGNKHS